MQKLFLILIISGISFGVFAQKLGYIRNDSAYISGEIYIQSEIHSATSCMFKRNPEALIVTYTPDQILGYGYDKIDYYSIKIRSGSDSVTRFMLAIVQGDSPVYYLNEGNGVRFFIVGSNKEMVELVEKNGEYRQQLATYFEAPAAIIPQIHDGFNKPGIIRTVKFMKEASLEIAHKEFESGAPQQKTLSIKQKNRMRTKWPLLSISLQSGVTMQNLPLDLHAGLPADWDKFKSNSITYSLSADIPLIKYWPVTYHQEVCFNKFVSDYRIGTIVPDYQLIQDFSVISLPAMIRYAMGRKKFSGFIEAGMQFDLSMNKNNIGWLILSGDNNSGYSDFFIVHKNYSTFQTGITAGFGISIKLSKVMAINSEFRYSNVLNVLPDNPGPERQFALKAGITYNIFKKAQ
jgi:hypothetical protein